MAWGRCSWCNGDLSPIASSRLLVPGVKWHNPEVPSSAIADAKSRSRILRELTTFFLLAYAVSIILWLPLLVKKGLPLAFFSIGTFGPTVAALVTQRIFERNWKVVRIWSSILDLMIGVAVGASAVLVAAFTAAFFMTQSGIDRWHWSSLVQVPVLFIPNLVGGPLGEEPGWRGFALPRLQRHLNPVTSALVLGFLWANWHLPLMLAHIYNVTWSQFTILTMGASVFLSLAFNCSRGNVLCAIVVHGIYNVGTGVILNDMIGKATLYSNSIQHNILWLAYGGVAALLCIGTKGRLGCRTHSSTGETG